MKIGTSLSFCIQDICAGKVNAAEVKFIYSGTAAKTMGDWGRLVLDYCKSYWADFPEVAAATAMEFIMSGRVIQPRLEDRPTLIRAGIWIEEEDFDRIAANAERNDWT